jgi:L-rhamnose mutarotase
MAMIYRHQLKARIHKGSDDAFSEILKEEKDQIEASLSAAGINLFKLFKFDNQLFVYAESADPVLSLELPAKVTSALIDSPGDFGDQKFVPMLDIFHDAIPRVESAWREPGAPITSLGSIVYLRPEKYCSYVFYHFQLQEEGLRKFNKRYIIGALENCLFSYQEFPAVIDATNHDRVLDTNVSPENWVELMGEHFQPWPEGLDIEKPWKEMEEIFSYVAGTSFSNS